jgi:hypothetical protein
MSRREREWDETFLDEVMAEIRAAVLEVSRRRAGREQVVVLRSQRSVITISVRREPHHA